MCFKCLGTGGKRVMESGLTVDSLVSLESVCSLVLFVLTVFSLKLLQIFPTCLFLDVLIESLRYYPVLL